MVCDIKKMSCWYVMLRKLIESIYWFELCLTLLRFFWTSEADRLLCCMPAEAHQVLCCVSERRRGA